MQAYSNPKRERHYLGNDKVNKWSLPDLEIFYLTDKMIKEWQDEGHEIEGKGFYYWYCFPGCSPDSDIMGPFASEELALADARENSGYEDEDETED